jgi:hypothetical protein
VPDLRAKLRFATFEEIFDLMPVGLRSTLGSFPKEQENCSRLVFA